MSFMMFPESSTWSQFPASGFLASGNSSIQISDILENVFRKINF